MEVKTNEVSLFNKVLEMRGLLRKISQISWNLNQLEKRYPLDALTDGELKSLYEAYSDYIAEVKSINLELQTKKYE